MNPIPKEFFSDMFGWVFDYPEFMCGAALVCGAVACIALWLGRKREASC